jgi:hypothetical protein
MDELATALAKALPEDDWFVARQSDGSIVLLHTFSGQQDRAPRLLTIAPDPRDPSKIFYIEAEDSDGLAVVI